MKPLLQWAAVAAGAMGVVFVMLAALDDVRRFEVTTARARQELRRRSGVRLVDGGVALTVAAVLVIVSSGMR